MKLLRVWLGKSLHMYFSSFVRASSYKGAVKAKASPMPDEVKSRGRHSPSAGARRLPPRNSAVALTIAAALATAVALATAAALATAQPPSQPRNSAAPSQQRRHPRNRCCRDLARTQAHTRARTRNKRTCSQYALARTTCSQYALARTNARTNAAHTQHTRARTRARAHTHTHTHTEARTQIY